MPLHTFTPGTGTTTSNNTASSPTPVGGTSTSASATSVVVGGGSDNTDGGGGGGGGEAVGADLGATATGAGAKTPLSLTFILEIAVPSAACCIIIVVVVVVCCVVRSSSSSSSSSSSKTHRELAADVPLARIDTLPSLTTAVSNNVNGFGAPPVTSRSNYGATPRSTADDDAAPRNNDTFAFGAPSPQRDTFAIAASQPRDMTTPSASPRREPYDHASFATPPPAPRAVLSSPSFASPMFDNAGEGEQRYQSLVSR